jgi:hypothetical protein
MAMRSKKLYRVLLATCLPAILAVSLYPSVASAATNAYTGKNLPGKSWTTGNGVVLSGERLISAWGETTSSVCVGPVTHDSGGFHMPYGWACNPHAITWEFTPITAAAGFDNPNPGTIPFFEVFAST